MLKGHKEEHREAQRFQTMIVDPTQPFLDVAFFERCARAAKAVARLESDSEPLGTAFLISRNLVLTAYQNIFDGRGQFYPELHCVQVLFDYAADVDGSPLAAIEREGDIAGIMGEKDGHWAVVPLTRPAPRRFPTLDIDPNVEITTKQSAHIIHHPEGEQKKVTLGNSNIVTVEQNTFSYTTNTVAGSSGAPIFNDSWQLLGIHYSGDHDACINRAVTVERIHRDLRARRIDFRTNTGPTAGGPPQLFISACGQDRDVVEKLEAYLAPLRRAGKLTVWHHGRIAPGTSVEDVVGQHLRAASIILLVTSADYMNSEASMSEALTALTLPQKPTVIPVLARPCLWEYAPFGALQPLPEERVPLMRSSDPEDAFASLAKAIGAVVTDGEF